MEKKIVLERDEIKYLKDSNGISKLQDNSIFCSECSSVMELISLNNNNIYFKCSKYNEHELKMNIKNYLDKIKQYNNMILNNSICSSHQKEYYSFCFDCNMHLCKECRNIKIHNYHYKIFLEEIMPEIY